VVGKRKIPQKELVGNRISDLSARETKKRTGRWGGTQADGGKSIGGEKNGSVVKNKETKKKRI